MSNEPALVIFARAPLPGQTKTRLIPALGPAGAAELYRRFLVDTLGRACELRAEVLLAAAAPEQTEPLSAIAQAVCPRARVTAQQGTDLGARMSNALQEALQRGHPSAVVMGTDLPSLPFDRVARALSLLRNGDVQRGRYCELVLGPSLDGGYYLIGMSRPMPQLFQHMDWGSGTVLVDTLRRAQTMKAAVSLLEPWYDVDTPEDLAVLRAHLTALALVGEPMPCPATWEYLREQVQEH
jgi:hypothetical protein